MKCNLCGKTIRYNKFEQLNGRIFCPLCAKEIIKKEKEIIEPTEQAKESLKDQGVELLSDE